jgi:hypothetical protein
MHSDFPAVASQEIGSDGIVVLYDRTRNRWAKGPGAAVAVLEHEVIVLLRQRGWKSFAASASG